MEKGLRCGQVPLGAVFFLSPSGECMSPLARKQEEKELAKPVNYYFINIIICVWKV